jgi:hypothetical protein
MLKLDYYIKKENKWIKKEFLKNIKSVQTKNKIVYLWLYDKNHKKIGKIKITEVANI